jgi:hypothetical protein
MLVMKWLQLQYGCSTCLSAPRNRWHCWLEAAHILVFCHRVSSVTVCLYHIWHRSSVFRLLVSKFDTSQEGGWASELVWTQRLQEESFVCARDRTPVVQPVVRHYTDWTTPNALSDPTSDKDLSHMYHGFWAVKCLTVSRTAVAVLQLFTIMTFVKVLMAAYRFCGMKERHLLFR